MQIHELNDYTGELNAGAYVAVDDGNDTGKVSASALVAHVENEISELDTFLNGRIDNIIAGGAAPSEAEIVDARYGDNGVTYPSLGDAIRGQVSDLKGALTTITGVVPIKLKESTSYSLTDIGTTLSPTPSSASNFASACIPVNEGDVISVNIAGGGSATAGSRAWAFTDENYEVLKRSAPNNTLIHTELYADADGYLFINTKTNVLTDPYYVYIGKLIDTEIANINEDLKSIQDASASKLHFKWVNGGIDASTGANNNDGASDRSRDETYYPANKLVSVKNDSSVSVYVLFYTYSGGVYTFVSNTLVSAGNTYNFTNSAYYVRFDVRGSLSEAKLVTVTYNTELISKVREFDNALPFLESLQNTLTISEKEILANADKYIVPANGGLANYVGISSSEKLSCQTGDTLTYTLSAYGGCLILATYDKYGKLNNSVSSVDGNTLINGTYTFDASDVSFRVSGVTSKLGSYKVRYNSIPEVIENDIDENVETAKADIINNTFNSAYVSSDIESIVSDFCDEYAECDDADSLIFFTDPHLMGFGQNTTSVWIGKFKEYVSYLQKVYNSSPLSMCICGGDWLNNNDSKSQASFKLGYLNGVTRSMFKHYLPVVGNHDSNEQGQTTLTTDEIKNLMLTGVGRKLSYTYTSDNSKAYVIHIYGQTAQETHDTAHWLCNELLNETSEKCFAVVHGIYNTYTDAEHYVLYDTTIFKIIKAFNERGTYTYQGVSYDFTNCTGYIRFALAGHLHIDLTGTIETLPFIITTNFTDGNVPTFDMIITDWTNSEVICKRVGTGSDRTVQMLAIS